MPFILKYHTFRFFSMRLYIILCDFKSSFKIFSKICRIFCILFQYGRQIRPYIDFLFLLNYNSRKRLKRQYRTDPKRNAHKCRYGAMPSSTRNKTYAICISAGASPCPTANGVDFGRCGAICIWRCPHRPIVTQRRGRCPHRPD